MADLSVLKNIVRTGRVSSVNAGNRTARVTFEDKGQSPLVSGELKVIKNPPFIPAKGALYNISQYFNVNNSNNTFDFISTKPPEIWTDTFALPTADDVVMPVSDISRILGWEFSYTDNILNVVTDSLDDTKEENLLLIETQTSTESVDLDDWDAADSSAETESEGQ